MIWLVVMFVVLIVVSVAMEAYYKGRPKAEDELLNEIYEVLSVSEKQKNEKGDYYLIVVKNSASDDIRLYQMKEIPPKIFRNVGDIYHSFPDPTK